MENKYSGECVSESKSPEEHSQTKTKFYWWEWISWIIPLLISFVPIFVNMAEYLLCQNDFWGFVFLCFTKYDGLWIFVSFITCVLLDWLYNYMYKKHNIGKFKHIVVITFVIIILVSFTWFIFRKVNKDETVASVINIIGLIEIFFVIMFSSIIRINTLLRCK